MCFGARARALPEGGVVVELMGRDNNLVPYRGEARSFYRWSEHVRFAPGEEERAAEWAEGFAESYDSGCIREKGASLNGARAYSLWAERFARAGMVLRPPRADKIFYGGMPPNIGGPVVPTDRTLRVEKGQVLDLDTMRRLCKVHPKFPVEIDGRSCRIVSECRGTGIFALAHNRRNRGNGVSSCDRVVAKKGFSGEDHWQKASSCGPAIPFRPLHVLSPFEGGMAIRAGESFLGVEGTIHPHLVLGSVARPWSIQTLAVFDPAAGISMRDRLVQHVSSKEWVAADPSELQREIVEAAQRQNVRISAPPQPIADTLAAAEEIATGQSQTAQMDQEV